MSDTESSRPKVSVAMITYNHERFIEQAVRSVMMQETDFDYELIIGEDCSTDRTREIVLRLKEEFPDKIRLLLHPQNIGMIPNFVAVYNACDGDYIALLEGDDYWTDPKKLQIQVDYMEAHPECRLSFCATDVIYDDDSAPRGKIGPAEDSAPGEITIVQWLRKLYIATASVVFRAPNMPLPNWYGQLKASGDWALILWLTTLGGDIHWIPTPSTFVVYRIHSGGVTQASLAFGTLRRQQRLQDALSDVRLVDRSIHTVQKLLWPQYLRLYRGLAGEYLKKGQHGQARKEAVNLIKYLHLLSPIEAKGTLGLLAQCYLPSIYKFASNIKHGWVVKS